VLLLRLKAALVAPSPFEAGSAGDFLVVDVAGTRWAWSARLRRCSGVFFVSDLGVDATLGVLRLGGFLLEPPPAIPAMTISKTHSPKTVEMMGWRRTQRTRGRVGLR